MTRGGSSEKLTADGGSALKTWVVANPKAGSGRALRLAEALLEQLPAAELCTTSGPGAATDICRLAVEKGVETVVAVGGDGTLQQCATGLCLDASGRPRRPRTRLALLPAGTGGDYRRSFELTASVAEATRRILAPRVQAVNVGVFDSSNSAGDAHRGIFVNVLSFGLGGLTDRIVERGPKWMGGRVAFFLGATAATLVHRPAALTLTIDGQELPTTAYSNVAICLGRYFGGGMQVAPDASPYGDRFQVVTMELSKPAAFGLARHIYRGTHVRLPGIQIREAQHVIARSVHGSRCLVDADGEQLGHLDLEVRLLPHQLDICL